MMLSASAVLVSFVLWRARFYLLKVSHCVQGGSSLLHSAARSGGADAVEAVLSHGADVNAIDEVYREWGSRKYYDRVVAR